MFLVSSAFVIDLKSNYDYYLCEYYCQADIQEMLAILHCFGSEESHVNYLVNNHVKDR